MVRKAIYLLLSMLAVCWLCPSLAFAVDPTIVGWWKLDEGQRHCCQRSVQLR